MDERTLNTLELQSLLELLMRHVQTPLGRTLSSQLRPTAVREHIELAQDLTSECTEYLGSGERFGLSGIEDPAVAVGKLQIEGTSLDPHQILMLERLISVGVGLREQFRASGDRERYPRLAQMTGRIPDLRRVLGIIRGKILPGGEIDDSASPELKLIRRELSDARSRIFRSLESIMKNQTRAVQEELVTFRNGRFVIPIRTDARNLVPGVVHGLSSSGQTTFLEPLTAIEQNNEIVRLHEQEEIEIARILFSITEALRVNLPAITVIRDTVAELDFSQAKGRLSLEFACTRPQLSPGRLLRLRDARHLLLEHTLRGSQGSIVPISLELDELHQLMVISGPNAGGKTVVLKTVGLISLMAQMGLHVPATEALLPVFLQVFADIGDQQSIASNLSTFTAHMRNIAEMVERVSPPALLLVDEVGTGTDPDEGTALAVAVLEYFRKTGATMIATTHYSGLKVWAAQTEGVLNASVEFDERTLRPTYRLILGVPGASSGLEIARRMNIPEGILQDARSRINPSQAEAAEYLKKLKSTVDDQEASRAALEQERDATARKYAQLDLDFAQREAERKQEFDRELGRVMAEFQVESERLIKGLKERAEAERMRKAAARRAADLRKTGQMLKQKTDQVAPGAPAAGPAANNSADIREGARVRVLSVDREGVVEAVEEGTCTVMVGPLRFRARPEELLVIEPPRAAAGAFRTSGPDANIDQDFVREVNVIGMTADEATARVDKFLDEAFVAGADEVRIIHGHGKGILRRAIAHLLTGHPQVEKFRLAPPEQGGGGATLVEIRN